MKFFHMCFIELCGILSDYMAPIFFVVAYFKKVELKPEIVWLFAAVLLWEIINIRRRIERLK